MSGFILERFAIHGVLFGYVLFILGPYLSYVAWWLLPVIFIGIMGACAVRGREIDRVLLRLWDRLDTPNRKAAVYFSAAFAPMLWLPLTKFATLLGLSLFLLGVFTAPACLKVLSGKKTALLTFALTLAVWLLNVSFGLPGKAVTALCSLRPRGNMPRGAGPKPVDMGHLADGRALSGRVGSLGCRTGWPGSCGRGTRTGSTARRCRTRTRRG